MAIKHIMLPLTGGTENANVAAYAFHLARQMNAHIGGCYEDTIAGLYGAPLDISVPPATYGMIYDSVHKLWKEREDAARQQFELAAKVVGFVTGPDQTQARATWMTGREDKACAFDIMTDLVVTALPGVDGTAAAYDVIDHVLFTACRPLLLVPHLTQQRLFQRPLIAWNGSREAENAVERSLELLKPGSRIAIAQRGHIRPGRMPIRRLKEYLHCQGFVPVEEDMEGRIGAVEDVLIQHADALHCDCIIMGAYTHSRARELLLGGVTDYMLRHSHLPLLMSH